MTGAPVRRVRVVRDRGGLGDVVRLWAVFAGLRRRWPEAELQAWLPKPYCALAETCCPDVDVVVPLPHEGARGWGDPLDPERFPHLAEREPCDVTVDLFCPAWAHERDTGGRPTLDRVEAWCRAAGVEPSTPRLALPERVASWGRAWAEELRDGSRGVVALHPYGTDRRRDWTDEGWAAVARALEGAGWRPVWFDGCGRVRKLPGEHQIGGGLVELAGRLAACAAVVGVDSGLFHVGGAVGTPALVVAGRTSGELLCRPWPLARWVQAPPQPGCDAPCHGLSRRGASDRCRPACRVLQALPADAVVPAVLDLLSAVDVVRSTC